MMHACDAIRLYSHSIGTQESPGQEREMWEGSIKIPDTCTLISTRILQEQHWTEIRTSRGGMET